ncbi:hypothetical protein EO087_05925 [Dyella sp. M7H15-1]|uniref:hypothetical protein n=1 Tax=Dyella sp. M7H15-1 TaxID=2501295 RepID=UPI001005104B|nr:hypothetical protein [Dyella sp. M7H15-1]QAU23578.1 hypothetical protein EO087_05925 [Dyella sp. M7H15-1]
MKPPRIVRHTFLVLATLGVSACGLGQAIHDGAVNVAKRTFTTPISTMNLDLINHVSGNDPAIVRIYQLKSSSRIPLTTGKKPKLEPPGLSGLISGLK